MKGKPFLLLLHNWDLPSDDLLSQITTEGIHLYELLFFPCVWHERLKESHRRHIPIGKYHNQLNPFDFALILMLQTNSCKYLICHLNFELLLSSLIQNLVKYLCLQIICLSFHCIVFLSILQKGEQLELFYLLMLLSKAFPPKMGPKKLTILFDILI